MNRHIIGVTSTALEVVESIDLTGTEAIVTGGTTGIGASTAVALASAGARVVVASRDQEHGMERAARIQEQAGGGPVVFRYLDLSSLESVTGWAERHAATGKPCHILIDNAGVMACPFGRTADGFELQFGTNHLGHMAFTIGLLPNLRVAGSARVVVLTSSAHRRADVDVDDPTYAYRPYDPWEAYGQSKSANALFAVEFNRRFVGEGITANAVMPGAIATGLQRHLSDTDRQARGWPATGTEAGPPPVGWKTPEQGAATSVWAATSPDLDHIGGKYLEDCAIAEPWRSSAPLGRGHYLPRVLDPARAARLWKVSEELIDTARARSLADDSGDSGDSGGENAKGESR